MQRLERLASILAAIAVLLAAASKVLQGESPSWSDVMLAIGVLAAAFGFQRNGHDNGKPKDPPRTIPAPPLT